MKTNLKTITFLSILIMLTVTGCSSATPTAAPAAEAPAPNMAGGVYEQAGYQLFQWTQGLTVLIWHDATQSSICTDEGSSGKGMNITICHSENNSGQKIDWQLETMDGVTGTLEINNNQYEFADGNVFTITTMGDPLNVQQFQRDLSAVTVERESIIAFTNKDTNLVAYLKYAGWEYYGNTDFGLGFHFPSDWYGPEVYTVEQDLRIEVGSDVVYPYGTDLTEQVYTLKDSYYILVEYTKSGNDSSSDHLYQVLAYLHDGESYSDARSLITRVRQVSLGDYEGYEFTSTLSESAQTEIFFGRQLILYGPDGSKLTITGQPNNVQMTDKSLWRDAYQAVDEANQELFYQVMNSIAIQ
jgi:hypothetical protein